MSDTVKWPNGAKCAVMLTFDFDAETLWLSRDPNNAKRPGVLSQGGYGGKVAVPKILELLAEEELKATFFVPGWTAEKYTDRVEAILKGGHEVGHHGYLHEYVTPDDPSREEEVFDQGMEALKRTVGVTPAGYRPPAGDISANMLDVVTRRGLKFVSSMMDDYKPYRHRLEDGREGPVELPWHWSLDDAIYFLFSIQSPRPVFTNSHVLDIWKEEFQEIYRWGGLFDLIMHPQVIGRPSRLVLLREFIAYARRFPGVWFATGSEVADAWLNQAQ